MPVSIDNTNHRIIIKAICPTNQGAITVNPTVAENATCSLAPGTVLDLHGTQTFTVTAEDGTQTEYSIYVTGCSLYGSHFYRGCGVYRQIDCIVQDNNASGMAGSALYLSLNELPDSDGVLEDEFSVTFDLENTNFTSGTPVTYEINPYVGQHSKASFTFYSGAFLYVASPAGTISITNVDTKNKLISGSFSFGQFSNVTCGSGVTTDYIAGEFYSLPY